ncbi:MAG: acyclic terpene utilization AtuA family protein [Kiritimatiellae bacterium]|nr:acyclic terpene utilization AtuA family protein [Kiritimatiellia bacterium]
MHDEMRVLSPTGILGYGFPEESFRRGLKRKPHLIGVDAGSTDPGPYYLGSGKSFTSRAFVKRDLRFLLTAGARLDIPLVIGSAGGAGARPHLEWCRGLIHEVAREEKLSFRMGVIFSDVSAARVLKARRAGDINPLPFAPPLTAEAVKACPYIAAQVGVEPIIRALRKDCRVVLCGRCYDPAVFAALPIAAGYDPGLAMHMGKILECAAIAAAPGSGADCVLGTLRRDAFILESLNPARKFSKLSTAAHTLYEKSDPCHLPGPGGVINLEKCAFRELAGGRVEVRGSRFEKTPDHWVKLEGARRTGFRSISIAGTRDPVMIAGIDDILKSVESQVQKMGRKTKLRGRMIFHVYGKNGVMGALEPRRRAAGHELGIVMEALAGTQEEADMLCSVTRSTLLHYGYPGRISTAGNLALLFSPSDIRMGAVYEFAVYHLMKIKDPAAFPLEVENIRDGKARS